MPCNNLNSDFLNVLTNQIDFYFVKLTFSLLGALYTLENLRKNTLNFATMIRHMPHKSDRKYALSCNVLKNYFIPIFKTLKLRK